MSIDNSVPFYSNTPDDTHCFQAALKMILKFFLSDKDFNWEELDKITAKQKDMWTWTMAGLCWLDQHGFEVINIEEFDYELFVKQKELYLIDKFGEMIAKEQINNSVINAEIKIAKRFVSQIKTDYRLPTINEIRQYLDTGYLLIANVNARSLTDREGFAGHFVVIKGYDEGLILHDPGLAPRDNIHVSTEQFMKGWDYPDENARNLIALKLRS